MRCRQLSVVVLILGIAATAHAKPSRKIAPLTPSGLPNVQSAAALVVDLDSHAPLLSKNVEEVRSIASTGKIFVAMVARRKGLDLDGVTVITADDAAWARGGARTRLTVGHGFRNVDLLRAMLISSDNRAPSALGRAVGLKPNELIAEMNKLARDLGLAKTKFTDCSGLNGNQSTAKDMLRGLEAAMSDPLLAEIMTTRDVVVQSIHPKKPKSIHYRNTNRPLHNDAHDVLGGKTGFTKDAGYCLLVASRVDGRRLGMVFLGSEGELTRFGDFKRVTDWFRGLGSATVQR